MSIVIGFLPFIAFAVLAGFGKVFPGLLAALALAIGVMLRGNSLKLLEVGSAVLFGALALYAALAPPPPSALGANLAVNAGLTAIVLVSLAMGRPFTLAYAREQVPQAMWSNPLFLATNRRITSVWAAAFAAGSAAGLVLIYAPAVPPGAARAAGYGALAAAIWFTRWYPARVRARFASPAGAPVL